LKIAVFSLLLIFDCNLKAQAIEQFGIELIMATLNKYIEGSTNIQPKLLEEAFHSDLNLYYINKGEFKVWSGIEYIEDTKEGELTGELDNIVSIDYKNDIGFTKVQISHPDNPIPYIDYFMLIKMEGSWKIVHKLYANRMNE